MMRSKIQETTFASNETLSFIFEENHVFIEEGNPQAKLMQLRKNKMKLI